jgi:NTP pyrophosphatase (non-canonical NTP hydrolase)
MAYYSTLRAANDARELEWDTGGVLDGSFYSNELAGEVGEAIDAARKLAVYDDEVSVEQRAQELRDELADVIICIDLLAKKFGMKPIPIVITERTGDLSEALLDLAVTVGIVANAAKKLERERLGLVGSRVDPRTVESYLFWLSVSVGQIAAHFDIDLVRATAAKFNKTSEKINVATRLMVDD